MQNQNKEWKEKTILITNHPHCPIILLLKEPPTHVKEPSHSLVIMHFDPALNETKIKFRTQNIFINSNTF